MTHGPWVATRNASFVTPFWELTRSNPRFPSGSETMASPGKVPLRWKTESAAAAAANIANAAAAAADSFAQMVRDSGIFAMPKSDPTAEAAALDLANAAIDKARSLA